MPDTLSAVTGSDDLPAARKDTIAAADAPRRPRRRSGGVSVVVGGLLQDLEDRLRRDLAPIEERVRRGEETRGLAGGRPADRDDLPVIVLPGPPAGHADRG